jgi:Tol biopolymer transport system component
MALRDFLTSGLFAIAGLMTSCGASGSPQSAPLPSAEFSQPQRVTIPGYTGDAMEPFISLDGTTLFFNNNNAAADTNLYYAQRVDAVTFQYQGPVTAANSTALDAVASMDQSGKFYFISTRSYSTDLSTVYRGDWSAGTLANVAEVTGIPASAPGLVIFDAGISADGTTLCFAEGDYHSGTLTTSNLVLADRTATGFTRSAQSATILQQVNLAGGTQYAPAFSADGLELYFTRLVGGLQSGTPAIYVASRTSTASAFGAPHVIPALTGVVEAPSLSADGKSLYYHALVNGQFQIYRATRP